MAKMSRMVFVVRIRRAIAAAMAMSAFAASAAPWFDAGVSTYESWPSDGMDKVLTGVGTWSGTGGAKLSSGEGSSRLNVDTTGEAPLGFDAAVMKSIAADKPSITTTVRFSASDEALAIDPLDKALVTVAAVNGVPRYFGLAADPVGGTNTLYALDGATPDETADVVLGFSFKEENGETYVRYSIDGVVLKLEGSEWLRTIIPAERASVASVCYAGMGDVVELAGEVGSDEPAATKTLTISELDHVVVESVKVAGADVEPDEKGNYIVEQGSVVTVAFAPEAGWALNVHSMTFVVNDDMTLPTTGRPTPVNVAADITINEVMAKNGVTLLTKTGFEGLDWVELYNSGNEDADLAGWYMGNDPTKAPDKWKKIKGTCVVPAKGYKIVWFDGDKLNKNWAADEAYVEANISTDAGKHTLFLASTNASPDNIVQQIKLPGGVKDISYGRGHLSRTLVSSTSAAEYKVGNGEWTAVDGPVGMSAAAGGFTVVSYQINKDVGNMDVVDACLLDSSTWKAGYPVTNTTQTVAFAGPNQTVSFDQGLYSAFPGVSGNNFICVATATVQIPESGDWTFDVGSDDGFSAKLRRLDREWGWESRGSRGYGHSTATFNLEAGAYEVEVRYFNAGGGYAIDFSAAKGRTGFNADTFHLVGMGDIVHAGALGAQVAADVSDEMVGKSKTLDWKTTFTLDETPVAADGFRLLVKYADGFTARVNGTPVASVAAAAARPAADALRAQEFVIDPALVHNGENTLEITAENDAIGDTEFYLSAELVHDMSEDMFVYFPTPTPGAVNSGSGRTGFTPKVAFSEPHGWKDAAFDLTLSCADNDTAVIYYTLDGTSPVIGAPTTYRYTEPLHIEKTTVVRAAVPDVDAILQYDMSATYLFYEDVISQDSSVPEGFPADKQVNNQAMRYGFDAAVTQGDADTQARLRRGLTENTRTVSLVIDPKSMFDGASGIYVNATGNGRIWERLTMVEQINPMDPEDEFTVPAGLRIRGAFSRGAEHPKHSFRLFFRSEYGMGTLEHPLFGDEGADEFEKIDFRTSQNYSWANNANGDTFIHECFSRDSEGAMGKTYNRSRYYHLFINGVYWGLYQTEERVDDNYAASYNGGAAANYDVVRTSQPGYNTGIVEGETAAWNELWRITTQEGYGEGHEANYYKVLGLNPDGTRNPEYPILLNVTNLIEHILTVHFTEDADSPVNSSGMANNIIGFRNRNDGEGKLDGFLWNRHDAEHSMGFGGGANQVKSLIWGTPEHPNPNRDLRALGNFNPNLLNYELMANAEYRRVFGDLVYKHMVKEGGALTAPVAEARYRARMAEIDDAIVCESARWGYQYETKRNRQSWLTSCNDRINFINNRLRYLIPEYQRRGWYPKTDAPTALNGAGAPLSDGTVVAADDMLYLTGSGVGTVYYTTDGSDPLGSDGAPSATAIEYSGASPIQETNTFSVIAKGDGWQYFDWGRQPSDDAQGHSWNDEEYDVASAETECVWESGFAPLGFKGETQFATTLQRYEGHKTSGDQVMTFYFRKSFTIPDETTAHAVSFISGTAWYDDGFVMYVNGTEVGRGNIGAGYTITYSTGTNETGTNYVDPADREFVFAIPTELLHAGENVVAVEVHQCHGTSSDAAWDLAMSYGTINAGNVEGGIAVPPEGLTINARVLANGEAGEWSALSTIIVKGEMPKADAKDGLRLAEAMTSALKADGDAGDFLVLTNIAPGEVVLDGVKIVAWNAKKNTEASPSLTYVFGAGASLMPGASLTIDGTAIVGAGGKLTNSQVGLRIYAADGTTLVQDVFLDADWWNGACDGTGEYFVAKTFGAEAKTHADWMPTATSLGEKLRVLEMYTSTTGDGGDTGEYIVLTNLDASAELDLTDARIVAWNAKKKSEADPSLTIVLENVVIPAGGIITIDQATYFGIGKLTNSKVGLKAYDAAGSCAQEVAVDADWWNGACDGTGDSFLALEFGAKVTSVDQWTVKNNAPQVPTIEGGSEVGTVDGTVATIDAALAGAGTQIFIPAGVTEVRMSVKDGDNVVIDTTAYYAGSLVPQDGTVTPALSEAVVKPSFAESAPKAGDAIVVTTEDVHLTASAKPGLYYTLMRCGTVNGTYEAVAGAKVQAKAEDATVSFDIKKGGASSAFFKVEVSDR